MLAVIALVLAFLLPVWFYVTSLQVNTATELSQSYAESAASRIVKTADSVFVQGKPAKVKMDVYMPKGVEQANITGRTVIFKLRAGTALSDVAATSISSLNGSLPTSEGTYAVTVQAFDNVVQITYS